MLIAPVEMLIHAKGKDYRRTFTVGSVSGARHASRNIQGTREVQDRQIAVDGHFSYANLTNPSIFRIARYLLTQSIDFEVQGAQTGGEGEVVCIREGDEIFISVGSDQCDRELDPLFPDKPKQMCPHPVAGEAWLYDDVQAHWDDLRIRSQVVLNGVTVPLQDAALGTLVSLEYLLDMEIVRALKETMFLYCGSSDFLDSTVDIINELGLPEFTGHGVGDEFHVQLHDPVLNRTLSHWFRPTPVGDDFAERNIPSRRQG